ncbi:hypothetical protein TTHERM_000354796 (macronuclear) [Tetrahymena thermophila SB210]|uniref:Uncharacterized protein n=1 Tax=Tetrahymena thermophila (strain SB210) TaxID=312017 RepID=W7XET9_TETTS|nr:hypothetical protein TTHERM_000354796 [Tetrahymena thermophila SB210]EWS75273.1 hypothetical protein TTHERM_000354796 [Tetrahymena thermophila SB210]|eukprot:XP_012652264.1 hypothetical protein TTHERM_000354796 [Tetrahymena thermophila SB210]
MELRILQIISSILVSILSSLNGNQRILRSSFSSLLIQSLNFQHCKFFSKIFQFSLFSSSDISYYNIPYYNISCYNISYDNISPYCSNQCNFLFSYSLIFNNLCLFYNNIIFNFPHRLNDEAMNEFFIFLFYDLQKSLFILQLYNIQFSSLISKQEKVQKMDLQYEYIYIFILSALNKMLSIYSNHYNNQFNCRVKISSQQATVIQQKNSIRSMLLLDKQI